MPSTGPAQARPRPGPARPSPARAQAELWSGLGLARPGSGQAMQARPRLSWSRPGLSPGLAKPRLGPGQARLSPGWTGIRRGLVFELQCSMLGQPRLGPVPGPGLARPGPGPCMGLAEYADGEQWSQRSLTLPRSGLAGPGPGPGPAQPGLSPARPGPVGPARPGTRTQGQARPAQPRLSPARPGAGPSSAWACGPSSVQAWLEQTGPDLAMPSTGPAQARPMARPARHSPAPAWPRPRPNFGDLTGRGPR